jgi:RNA polymerase sigma-70 factor (ECF subfamily)
MPNTSLIQTLRDNERDLLQFLAARLKSAFAAQDLVQDLYLKVRGLDEKEQVRNGRAYLFRMASNLAIDHLRRERRRAELIAEAGEFLTGGIEPTTPEQSLIARNELVRLERALAELPELTRRIFILCRLDGLPQRRVAEIVGLSPAGVFKHMRRAVDHLARVRDS